MKRKLKQVQEKYADGEMSYERAMQTVNSYMGILKHCDSYSLRRAIFGEYTKFPYYDGWFYLQRNSKDAEGDGK